MALALYTFGMFARRADDPANASFDALNGPIFETVDRAPGLIARSGYASDPGPDPWGSEIYPRFYEERGDGWSPATLSLWQDLESIFCFTYTGLHQAALRRGREWFEEPRWPPLVLWWHEGEGYPHWAEGASRLERLHDHGPGPAHFTFRAPFGPDGQPIGLNRTRLAQLKASASA
ncbi:DUF3291 domain-containing protein [Pseudoroseicyclus aestuarii]|uniref:Uncharacterized protein DUF3291 n=1 Tax=Pseudoroseicyclus aestuarii TaxID=1795041 RepID=A0A318SVB6_9RHOB|nr:DUF3291 domain-containing protein [Pseudoroseicyclus aestuarii]PYE85790.1 uncharacterized protein DUF3291 [Pseudoroseicyclus aestuarii]